MAKALPSGRPVRRPLFGALDPDGWTWAGIKAMFWFIVILLVLGYIPDRAYYFTVNKTIDLGLLAWSPINLCPAENRGLPCPAPAGALVPWEPSPAELALPAPRTAGAAAQLATHLLYAGGSDGGASTNSVFVSEFKDGAFGPWANGPALPEARADARIVVLSGVAYLVGGTGPDGEPTDTVWSLKADEAGALTTWAPVEGVTLPAARTGAGVVALSDGILVAGGRGPDGQPTTTVWKSTLDSDGALGAFAEQPALLDPVADAGIALDGDFVWVLGGTNANGASGGVQRGRVGAPEAAAASPIPGASAAAVPQGILQWAVSDGTNLPEARTAAAAFSANGTVYVIGGSDGQRPQREIYWAVPDASGNLTGGWHHLDTVDLPAGGLQAGSPVLSGSYIYVIGGTTESGPSTGAVRANLAPQPPFFQLGIAGLTVPALAIPGEIGQQLGYLAAAGVGTGNFVLLCAVAWLYSNKPKVRAWWERRRASRRGRRAEST